MKTKTKKKKREKLFFKKLTLNWMNFFKGAIMMFSDLSILLLIDSLINFLYFQ